MTQHTRSCPAYGNYQPPYEECNCRAEELDTERAKVRKLTQALQVYDTAARLFIKKVDEGAARSHRTYADLKAALEISTEARR